MKISLCRLQNSLNFVLRSPCGTRERANESHLKPCLIPMDLCISSGTGNTVLDGYVAKFSSATGPQLHTYTTQTKEGYLGTSPMNCHMKVVWVTAVLCRGYN